MGDIFAIDTSAGQEERQNAAMPSNFYAASGNFAAKTVSVAADRYKLLTPADGANKIGTSSTVYSWGQQQTPDLSNAAHWDTIVGTDGTVAANRAGKDLYLYEVPPTSGTTPVFLWSFNASAPSGYTTADSRLVAGCHGLCVAVAHATTLTGWTADTVMAVGQTIRASVWDGFIYRCTVKNGDFKTHATTEPDWASIAVGATIVDDQITWIKEQHSLEGYLAGDILPASVWDLKHCSFILHVGLVYSSLIGKWISIYLPSGTGSSTASVYGANISFNRLFAQFEADLRSVGKMPLSLQEYGTAMLGGLKGSVIVQPATAGGHSDAYGRRLVSHIGCEDGSGAGIYSFVTDGQSSNNILLVGNGGPRYVDTIQAVETYTAAFVSTRSCVPSKITG
jgi:hypothetical protein